MPNASPTLISIETSTELASVSLLREGRLLSRESTGAQTHSSTVPRMIQSLLADAGLRLSQCDAVAFGAGPGSFTGVRTACGLAQGLAFGAGIPVVPVVTLLAMAEHVRTTMPQDSAANVLTVLTVLDARMGEVYWARYRCTGRIDAVTGSPDWQVLDAPRLSDPRAIPADGESIVCGNGLAVLGDDIAPLRAQNRRPDVMPHATDILHLASIAVREGRVLHAREAQPFYLRNKVALTTQERLSRVPA